MRLILFIKEGVGEKKGKKEKGKKKKKNQNRTAAMPDCLTTPRPTGFCAGFATSLSGAEEVLLGFVDIELGPQPIFEKCTRNQGCGGTGGERIPV